MPEALLSRKHGSRRSIMCHLYPASRISLAWFAGNLSLQLLCICCAFLATCLGDPSCTDGVSRHGEVSLALPVFWEITA
ncbi:hypothetical protein BDV38DRAFT_212203 [Aspergillus pseudotamarii]|uniref:Uncharacterized protein n=1 Tax=Aspergillus pseudotamarii TaxID=132259 RepID=A0A5N6SG17_ASPPS|nr:uncharacterized protein BDV38DRAFT_212203 [Aspergillus pseudotamarii]KAE8132333.1 hypothetical protein BDV38DRAFT_212203 [Aspergillus pseudotamarii]